MIINILGKVLECIAENEAVNSTISTSVHLNVSCKYLIQIYTDYSAK